LKFGAGALPVISTAIFLAFSATDVIENTLHLVFLWFLGMVVLGTFTLELQILKIVVENGDNLEKNEEVKAGLRPLKFLVITAGLFSIAFVYSYFKSNNILEKKFDHIFSDFNKDQKCVTRTIASMRVERIKECYKCPSGKKCIKRKN
jgi:hypothetical protein